MTLPEALLPAPAAAEPVETETYDNAEGKVRSNCNVLTAVDPAVKVTGRLMVAPALPVTEPTPTDGGAADIIEEKLSSHITAVKNVTAYGFNVAVTKLDFLSLLSGFLIY
jgi:hypothetical protein